MTSHFYQTWVRPRLVGISGDRRIRVSYCSPRSRLSTLAIAFILTASAVFAQSTGYLPTGPHFYAGAGAGGGLEYRNLLLGRPPSATFAAGATFRGLSVSAWQGLDLTSTAHKATEVLGAYSHKLPLVDIHLGALWCRTDGGIGTCRSAARLGLTTNVGRKSSTEFLFDKAFEGGRVFTLSGRRELWRNEATKVYWDMSASNINYGEITGHGLTGRLVVSQEIASSTHIDFFWGGAFSRSKTMTRNTVGNGLLVGATLWWSH